MDPARLERAERDGDGLIPVMALVTVERSSLWFTAWLHLLFLHSDTSVTEGRGLGSEQEVTFGYLTEIKGSRKCKTREQKGGKHKTHGLKQI